MLSSRLLKIRDLVKKQAKVADVGCDHAILACSLVLDQIAEHVIATDLNEGPLSQARQTIKSYGLENQIEARLSDGLSNISSDEVDTIIIAGMGGSLIKSILENDLEKTKKMNQLILQPNIGEYNLRIFLVSNGFLIEDEAIIFENGKFYEIISAIRSDEQVEYTDEELFFGPILLKKRPEIMKEKYQAYLPSIINNLKRIPVEHENYRRFEKEKAYIIKFLGE